MATEAIEETNIEMNHYPYWTHYTGGGSKDDTDAPYWNDENRMDYLFHASDGNWYGIARKEIRTYTGVRYGSEVYDRTGFEWYMDKISGDRCTTQRIILPSDTTDISNIGMSGKWLMFAIGSTVYRLDTTNVANIEVVANASYNNNQQYTFCIDDEVVINGWYYYDGRPALYVRNKDTYTDGEQWGHRMVSMYKTYAYQEFFYSYYGYHFRNRYAFSGKIICGECGDTFKRRIHSCTDHKYIAWCCNTHIKDKDRCHMLFVKDDALKQAFTTMLNKLIFSHRQILKPYLESLKTSSSDDSLHRIQQIQTLLAQNTEKRETLTMLMTQGIIDPVLYSQETNELLSQADSFRDEIEALKNEVSGDVNKVTETTALIHFAEKSAMLQEFDKDLFDRYVKRITVHSRNDIRFELKCGLTLRERK